MHSKVDSDDVESQSNSEHNSDSSNQGRKISYKQMLEENIGQMMTRLKNSQNPEILEFNVVNK